MVLEIISALLLAPVTDPVRHASADTSNKDHAGGHICLHDFSGRGLSDDERPGNINIEKTTKLIDGEFLAG